MRPTNADLIDKKDVAEIVFDFEKCRYLHDASILGILKNRAVLAKIKAIPNADRQKLTSWINKKFNDFDRAKSTLSDDKIRNSKEYREIVYILTIADVIRPLAAADWSVDRITEAKNALGLESFETLEKVLIDKYGTPGEKEIHLHKGPGNGLLPHVLRTKEDLTVFKGTDSEGPRNEYWEEIGVGDHIYSLVESVLLKFVKEENRNKKSTKSFIKFLSIALQRALRAEWFNGADDVMSKWEKKVPFLDLNVIFKLLAKPNYWLKDWHNTKEARVLISGEFTDDSEAEIQENTHKEFLFYQGWTDQEVKTAIEISRKEKVKKQYKEKIKKLQGIKLKLAHRKSEEIDDIISELKEIMGEEIETKNRKDLAKEIGTTLRLYESKVRANEEVQRQIEKEKLEHGKTAANEITSDPAVFLKNFFSEEFINALQHASFYTSSQLDYTPDKEYPDGNGKVLDLNRHNDVYHENFAPTEFKNINKIIPNQSVLLMTGVRSESHESDKIFEEDLRKNIDTLKPGGIYLSDGFRESYTRVYRFKQIKRTLEGRKDVKAELVLDSEGNPIAVLIQKIHPEKGYLTDEEKKKCFKEKISFSSVDSIARRLDIKIINRIREKIRRMWSHDINVFQAINDLVRTKFEQIFIEAGLEKERVNYGLEIPQFEGEDVEEIREKTLLAIRKALIGFHHELDSSKLSDEVLADYYLEIDEDVKEGIEKRNLLDSDEIKECEDQLLNGLIVKINEWVKNIAHTVVPILERVKSGNIVTFPRLGQFGPLNEYFNFKSDKLPNNAEFATAKMQIEIESKEKELLSELKRLQTECGIQKPLVIIDFADCSTNDLLMEKIKDILGPEAYDEYVEVIKIEFKPGDTSDPRMRGWEENETIDNQIQKLIREGGIVIMGGSYYDPYDPRGKVFKEKFGHPIVEAVKYTLSKVRILPICFSAQFIADIIGNKLRPGEPLIDTRPGMLEFGPVPVRITHGAKNHPFLRGLPSDLTMAFTHSGHVDDHREGETYRDTLKYLEPLANSRLTGRAVIWTGLTVDGEDRALLFQGHPEIDLVDKGKQSRDIDRIIEEFGQFDDQLKRDFGSPARTLGHNFKEIMTPKGEPRIKGNAGRILLLRGLTCLSKTIH